MGQKVSPVGMRVGINRDWHSRWFANDKDFSRFLLEDVKVRRYVNKNLKSALISHVEIERRKAEGGDAVDDQTAGDGSERGNQRIHDRTLEVEIAEQADIGFKGRFHRDERIQRKGLDVLENLIVRSQ